MGSTSTATSTSTTAVDVEVQVDVHRERWLTPLASRRAVAHRHARARARRRAGPRRQPAPRRGAPRVEAVDYAAARRLLVDALRDGGNAPAAMPRIAILDDRGNHLLELAPAAPAPMPSPAAALAPSATAAGLASPESTADADRPPWTRRWLTWAIPTGVFALGAAGFGIASIASYAHAHTIAADSGKSFLSDARDSARRGRIFAWITIGAGAATAACAIPMAIYLARDAGHRRVIAAPTARPGALGLVLAGRF
jgi:hypothetical protein